MHGEHDRKDGQGRSDDQGRHPGALDDFSQQDLRRLLERLDADIAVNPDDATALSARGLVHQQLGDDRRAKEDFGKALRLSPGDAEAHHTGGMPAPSWGSTA